MPPLAPKFYCVNDSVPAETTRLLEQACRRRRVDYHEIETATFDFNPKRRLKPGDLLYTPAVAPAAGCVQQFLWTEGVVTFFTDPNLMFYDCLNYPLLFERAELPGPRTFPLTTNQRPLLRSLVKRIGGLPAIIKVPGWSNGIGVIRVDSAAALFSVVDCLLAQRSQPSLCEYIPGALHWRVIVIGDRAVACYRNPLIPEDFRSHVTENKKDYFIQVPEALAKIAVKAVHTLRLEFGGVDILQTRTGKHYLLETNFPCYFPQAQKVAGIDIAGMMLDHLLAKR